MVRKKRGSKRSSSRGSLLGRSSKSSSEDKTDFYLVSIVAVVAVVALVLMLNGGKDVSDYFVSEDSVVSGEEGSSIAGMGYAIGSGKSSSKKASIVKSSSRRISSRYSPSRYSSRSRSSTASSLVRRPVQVSKVSQVIMDSDNDGVINMYDVCPGYNDHLDTDGDGIPDGCDTEFCTDSLDNDGDGRTDCNDNDCSSHSSCAIDITLMYKDEPSASFIKIYYDSDVDFNLVGFKLNNAYIATSSQYTNYGNFGAGPTFANNGFIKDGVNNFAIFHNQAGGTSVFANTSILGWSRLTMLGYSGGSSPTISEPYAGYCYSSQFNNEISECLSGIMYNVVVEECTPSTCE